MRRNTSSLSTSSKKGAVVLNFIILAFIRGTTPLMMFVAVTNLNSAALVVLIKCTITTIVFSLSLLCFLSRDMQMQCHAMNNLRKKDTYWKLAIIGFIQSAAPYMLVIYSLKYLPPTLLGVFIVVTPWCTTLIQRLPMFKPTEKLPRYVKIGMVIGTIGIILILSPVIKESSNCNYQEVANSSLVSSDKSEYYFKGKYYHSCLPAGKLILSISALILAPLFWASATIFWKHYRGDTHYLVSSIGQNSVGALISIIVWLWAKDTPKSDMNDSEVVLALMFLGIATGWLATLLVQHLFAAVGAKLTNQVLTAIPLIAFIEDCIFVRDVVTATPWAVALELLGVLLVTVGLFISNYLSNPAPKTPSSGINQHQRMAGDDTLHEPLIENEDSSAYNSDVNNEMDEEHLYTVPPIQHIDDHVDSIIDYEIEEEEEHEMHHDFPPLEKVT